MPYDDHNKEETRTQLRRIVTPVTTNCVLYASFQYTLSLLYKETSVRKRKTDVVLMKSLVTGSFLPCVSWCSSSVSPSSLPASSFSPRFYPPFPFSLPFCPPFIHFKSEAYRGYSGSLGDFGSIVFIVASQVSSSLVDREYSSQS